MHVCLGVACNYQMHALCKHCLPPVALSHSLFHPESLSWLSRFWVNHFNVIWVRLHEF